MVTKRRVELVVIDPQNDFCDKNGALSVDGADGDMQRLAGFVEKNGRYIDDIHVTLDSHHTIDVAHPAFWCNSAGENPSPFTIISVDDIDKGVWRPVSMTPVSQRGVAPYDPKAYFKELAAKRKYQLCIWPPHCLIGSWGNNIFPVLFDAFKEWETNNFATLNVVTKGSHPYTEHYSAVQAEVPDPKDITTQLNVNFIQRLKECDVILIAGEALSHCVANTFYDVAEAFGDDSYIKKLVLLKDACNNVTGFDNLGKDFIKKMTARGMQVSSTQDFAF